MATKRNRRAETSSRTSRPRRKKRPLWRFGFFLLLLFAAAAMLPTIIAKTPLRNTFLGWAMPEDGWRILSKDASLTWTGSQTLTDLSLVDPDGNPLLQIESITLERSLLSLAADRNNLGKLKILRPIATLVARPEGSNLEDLLASLTSNSAKSTGSAEIAQSTPLQVEIEIVEGTLRGFDQESQRQWLLTDANITAQPDNSSPDRFEAVGSAALSAGQSEKTGHFNFRLQSIATDQQQLDLLAEQLPVEPLRPWLARILPGAWITGHVSTDAQLLISQNDSGQMNLESSGRMEAKRFELVADALAGDRLRLDTAAGNWNLTIAGETITVRQLAVDADWAKLQASGSFSQAQLASLQRAHMPQLAGEVTGKFELAQLAAMLPHAMRLREGVQIDSGVLEFHVQGKPDSEGTLCSATAQLGELAGSDGQRAIRWKEPVEIDARALLTQSGPRLQKLSLAAPFAEAEFETADQKILGNFQFDLEKLSQELGQFVNLQAWQLRGRGEGNLSASIEANQLFEANAALQLTALDVARGGKSIWVEPRLQVDLFAKGTVEDFSPRQIDSGTLKMHGAHDSFDAKLLAPVTFTALDKSAWKVKLSGNGPLASWAGRLRPWVSGIPRQLEGAAQFNATLTAGNSLVEVANLSAKFTPLQIRHREFVVDEPQIELSGDLRWDAPSGNLASREFQLVSSSLALRTRDLLVNLGASEGPTASGAVAFRANLERLSAAMGLVGQRNATWPRGSAVGQLQLASDSRQVRADISLDVEQLQIVRNSTTGAATYGQPEVVWTEPQLRTSGKLVYTNANDRAVLESLAVNGQTVRLTGSAEVDKLRSEAHLKSSGVVQYNPEAVARLVATYVGPEFRLEGDQLVRFQISGPLLEPANAVHWSRRWNMSTEAGWLSANAFGMPLGEGKLQATLQEGELKIAPLNIAIGQGRLTAAPQAELSPGREQMILPSGPFVKNVQISPQVSETMLKYVAPILAGATRTEGQFSVDLQGAQLPVQNPQQSRVVGKLSVHQLRVSPGPMVEQFATVLRQIEAISRRKQFLQTATSPKKTKLLSISDTTVDFQVSEGRVYHRDLQFLIDDVPVRSYGSVGFDQTLALVLEIPIQDKWLGDEKALRSLAGQTLQVPIHGTFQNPRIDQRAVADLSQKLLESAATQVIGDELNRALDKLFK